MDQEIKDKIAKHRLWLCGKEGVERANLSWADLSGADLSGANLRRADLSWADLSGANLRWADLSGADLSGANLRRADLSWADLSGANLRWADLSGADLSWADLSGANLRRADLSWANIPLVETEADLVARILERVQDKPQCLNMATWHTCKTTHCLAGWAVTLHSQGSLLESMIGPNAAGALIFNACCKEVPDFFSSEEKAVDWLRSKVEAT